MDVDNIFVAGCKYCGEQHLAWVKAQYHWQLINKDGKVHDCPQKHVAKKEKPMTETKPEPAQPEMSDASKVRALIKQWGPGKVFTRLDVQAALPNIPNQGSISPSLSGLQRQGWLRHVNTTKTAKNRNIFVYQVADHIAELNTMEHAKPTRTSKKQPPRVPGKPSTPIRDVKVIVGEIISLLAELEDRSGAPKLSDIPTGELMAEMGRRMENRK